MGVVSQSGLGFRGGDPVDLPAAGAASSLASAAVSDWSLPATAASRSNGVFFFFFFFFNVGSNACGMNQ